MKVSFGKNFEKSYRKCSSKVQQKFKQRLRLFIENPHHPILENHALHGEWQDFRSINITGDYRALYYHIDADVVEFFIIDTHGNLYG
jgi:addiction module RelE/StbE family toxin